MVTANKIRLDDHEAWRERFPEDATILHDGKRYLAVRAAGDTGAFHPVLTGIFLPNDNTGLHYPVVEQTGVVYRPLATGTTLEDVMGATYAHWDGSAWHIAHCSPDEQVDFAAEAEAYAFQQFSEAIQRSNAITAQSDSNSGRNTGYARSNALINFAAAVGRRVHEIVTNATLGHYHRNPHRDHKRELTVAAIDRMLAEWQQYGATDHQYRHDRERVLEHANAVKSRLGSRHALLTRAQQAAKDAEPEPESATTEDNS